MNGETLEPGGVISANNWNISSRVQSITSGHGTFSLTDGTSEQNTAFFNTFRTTLGDIYQDQQINVNTQVDAHNNLKKPNPWKQILAMAASLLISMYLPGVMSGVIGSIFGSGVAATAASAAITAAAAGIASQLISNGRVDWDSLGKNVLVSALTAGITQHLGLNMDPEKFRNLSIGDKLVQTLKTGVVNAAVNVAINGGGTTAFLDSLKGSLLRMLTTHFTNQIPANWQGLEADIAHAVVGCLSARLGGGDCASGAIGGVLAHEIAPFVDDAVTSLLGSRNDPLRNPALTSVTALLSGLITQAVGRDGTTGFNTGVNAVLNNYLTRQAIGDALKQLENCNTPECQAATSRLLIMQSLQDKRGIDNCYAGVRCAETMSSILEGEFAIEAARSQLGDATTNRLLAMQRADADKLLNAAISGELNREQAADVFRALRPAFAAAAIGGAAYVTSRVPQLWVSAQAACARRPELCVDLAEAALGLLTGTAAPGMRPNVGSLGLTQTEARVLINRLDAAYQSGGAVALQNEMFAVRLEIAITRENPFFTISGNQAAYLRSLGMTDDAILNHLKQYGNVAGYGVAQSRINLNAAPTRFSVSNNNGLVHAVNGHYGNTNNASTFSVPLDDLKSILQSDRVVWSLATPIDGGTQFVRNVDVGRVIGLTPPSQGRDSTTWLRVITDRAGNITSTFPIRKPS